MTHHVKVTRNRVIAILVLLAAIAGAFAMARPDPLVVDTARVARQDLESTVDADGHVRVRDRFTVVAPVAGRLLRLTLLEGATVRRGDVVARMAPLPLDPALVVQARARLDAAKALVFVATAQARSAEVALEQRRRELSRARRLNEVGGIAPSVVEECEVALADAEQAAQGASQRVRASEADVRMAQAALAGDPAHGAEVVLVRAPADGRVLRLSETSERIVPAGTPILDIGDPRLVEVVIDVLSNDASLIARGDPVRLGGWAADSGDAEGGLLVGRVREVEPAAFVKLSALGVEERRVNVIVELPDVPVALGDGYRLDAHIIVWSGERVLAVPTNALVRANAGAHEWTAYVTRSGRVERRVVAVGHVGNGAAEVIAGLVEGDEVIVFPSDQVKEGVRVARRDGKDR